VWQLGKRHILGVAGSPEPLSSKQGAHPFGWNGLADETQRQGEVLAGVALLERRYMIFNVLIVNEENNV
jgi:hypothetical protein